MDAREIAKLAYQALEEKKAKDIKIIDIRDISVIADYFVIADGENQNQLQAMRDSVDETLLKAKVEGVRTRYHRSYFFKRRPLIL